MVQRSVQMDQPVENPATRVAAVMSAIRNRIANRTLTPGARLPSVRQAATLFKVSTSTVVTAYERLVAEGAVLSRPGSGFYVANQAAPFTLSEVGPRLDRAVDPFWVSRQSLEAGDSGLKPGCGWLPPSWLPEDAIRRAIRQLTRSEAPVLVAYASPLGLPQLRQLIARRMADRGIEVSPEQIMLTESGIQAIDFLCRFLLEPGDTVLVDDPCYFNFHALLRAHRANIVSVPYTPTGPDMERFATVVAEQRPRLYITNCGIHNPTGAVLSPVAAHRILKLAEQHDMIIIEDDIFADFEHVPAPRLAAFDGLDRVVHIGSFSKTLSASVRCGFIAARPDWLDGLTDLKIATSFGGGRLATELVWTVLSDGSYRKHLDSLKVRLSQAMITVAGQLRSLGIVPWFEPQAGIFLWCQLPDGIDAADVARFALDRGIVLAPGNAFSLSQSATQMMRFNVSQMQDQTILPVLKQALDHARQLNRASSQAK
ncbi:aminotransferase-like domain-containing protein [Rhizobium alvei]|uniref:PLP-dependent aminotransferase family protein n=1 Tax=Rhizobium alvei TaxID=1132659 RepID=A0ABT8YJS2_9HYPH|nr:PLP-dependent aminotransferase family protein [Rhizobium alvei]MDO6963771.1 PLP-dependent aminotransferase family protein [Rhizobium alvei]